MPRDRGSLFNDPTPTGPDEGSAGPSRRVTITVYPMRQPAVCRGCRRVIHWTLTYPGNRRIPLERDTVALSTFTSPGGVPIEVIDAGQTHFARCPRASSFSRRKARR